MTRRLKGMSSACRLWFTGGLIIALLLVCSAGLAGCDKHAKSDKPIVYASFYPIANLTKTVAGDAVEVRSFMPYDKDPHLWEPTPKDLKELAEADVLFVNGANMENWVDQVHDTLPDLKIVTLSDSVELITYKGAAAVGDFQYLARLDEAQAHKKFSISFSHTHESLMRVAFYNNKDHLSGEDLVKACKKVMEEKGEVVKQRDTISVEDGKVYALEMGHESGIIYYELPEEEGEWVFISDRLSEPLLPYKLTVDNDVEQQVTSLMENASSSYDKVTYDPHAWMSPVNAKAYANAIMNELNARYPEHEAEFKRNKYKLVENLTQLTAEYKEKFKDVRIKEFVTTHYAFAYLARDFDLKQFPLQGLTSTESPSLKTIRKAIDLCQYYQINTVFFEYGGNHRKAADTLASEVHIQTGELASMEYVTPQQEEQVGGYVEFMRMNLENLYQSMK